MIDQTTAPRTFFSALVVILVTVALLYGHTLHAPFYLDDQWAIVEKYLLRDLPAAFLNVFSQRGLTYLSFALNYRFGGLSLPLLHLTNIALHAGCGVLVWLLLRQLLPGRRWLPLVGALIFIAHPLQTQAVTYLIQRATVLATLLFLGAFLLHLRGRRLLAAGECRTSPRYLRNWLGVIALGGGAVLAKENTATLPLLLLAYDRLFPPADTPDWRLQLLTYAPFCLMPLLIGVLTFTAAANSPHEAVVLASMEGSTPLTYLVTQFSVVWVYLRLLIVPYGQALEHNYPVVTQLMTPQNALALAGLLVVAGLAWRVRRRRPLLVFGIVWFFLGLAVESSVIPLDPLFEHRLYLPMPGFVLVLLDGAEALVGKRRALMVLGLALLAFLPLTWRRNALWTDPIALYEDNLRHVPGGERASETLASLYARAGRYEEERQLLESTLRRYPRNYIVYVNLAKTFAEEHRMPEAFAVIEEGLRQLPTNFKLYETAAELAQLEGDRQRALAYLRRGLAVPGADRAILFNALGVFFAGVGDSREAERMFLESLAVDAARPETHLNLGKEYYAQRRWPEAVQSFRLALDFEPGNPETLEGLGMSALQLDDLVTARWAAGKLRYADRMAGQRLQSAIALGSRQGRS